MPFVAGGAAATPPDCLCEIPAHPCNLKPFLFGTSSGYSYGFLLVSSMAPFFEVITFLLFEPLGADFELSS